MRPVRSAADACLATSVAEGRNARLVHLERRVPRSELPNVSSVKRGRFLAWPQKLVPIVPAVSSLWTAKHAQAVLRVLIATAEGTVQCAPWDEHRCFQVSHHVLSVEETW